MKYGMQRKQASDVAPVSVKCRVSAGKRGRLNKLAPEIQF